MTKKIIISFLLLIAITACKAQKVIDLPIPTPAQLKWQNAELVAVFHYDLHVFDGKPYNQAKNRITPFEDYNIFNPTSLDTDQWVKAAKDAGFKIAILTATHETGFALYQSEVNPYSLKAVKWRDGKGDIVGDFVKSCRKYGIAPGIYIGIRWNSFFGVHDFKVQGNDAFAKNRQEYYNKMCEGMVKELCSNYGDLAIVWFDGGAHGPEKGGPDVLSVFEKHQPNGIFYHNTQRADIRWGGSESGTVLYPSWGTFPFPYSHATNGEVIFKNDFQLLKEGDPNGKYYMPAMSDAPLRGYNGRHEWFWEPNDEAHIFPLKNLMAMYTNSVGHNTSLIMGLTPDATGLLPQPDVQRLKEWGDEIARRFNTPLAETSGKGKKITLQLKENTKIDQIVLQENITQGERVRKFVLEGKTKKGWQTIFKGSSIGHKFIHVFDAMEVSQIRLIINESKGEPMIQNFEVFYTKKTKVACIGDSITYGAMLDNRDQHSYPAQLQELLGKDYSVDNFGVGSCTLIRKGRPTVWNELPKIKETNPDIIVISLGTNDTCGMGTCGDRKCWEYKDEYESDYRDLIDELSKLPSKPQIFICAPSPMVLETPGLNSERKAGLTVRKPRLQELIGMIKNIAKEKNVQFIDLNNPLDHRPELFIEGDGVHPKKEGYKAIAELVYQKLKK